MSERFDLVVNLFTGFGYFSSMERVRLFEPQELRCLLHDAGFVIEHELGDYGAGQLDLTSPRAIFFVHRS